MPKKKEQPDRMKWQDEMLEITRLRRERDTLLAALRELADDEARWEWARDIARAANAEVEGKP